MEQRALKFRAWNTEKKQWIYPIPFSSRTNGTLTLDIANFALSQFTGLKDKNGKEIYEGDLFACHYAKDGCKEPLMEVVYSADTAAFVFKRRGICQQTAVVQRPYDHSGWRGEIIGNIYENPELLIN